MSNATRERSDVRSRASEAATGSASRTGPALSDSDASAVVAGPGAGPSDPRGLRLALGIGVVAVLAVVAITTRPVGSSAAQVGGPGANASNHGAVGGTNAARLTGSRVPDFVLETPSVQFFDGGGLAGHSGVPAPPAQDADGRRSLGVIVGPSLFVWVHGGADGVRYSVVDLRGQVLSGGLTADQVYGAFPEINLPEMEFGPDGALCEPLMWAGDLDGLD